MNYLDDLCYVVAYILPCEAHIVIVLIFVLYSMSTDDHQYSEKGYFHNIGIDSHDTYAVQNQWKLRKLSSIMKELGHEGVSMGWWNWIKHFSVRVYFHCNDSPLCLLPLILFPLCYFRYVISAMYLNFHPREVLSRYRHPHIHVGDN